MKIPFQERVYIIRFGIVGCINTVLDVGVFSLLRYTFDFPLLIANSMAYLVAITNSFFLNKNWTFNESREREGVARRYLLFIILGLMGLALSNLTVWFLSHFILEIISKLASVVVLFVWNFATSRMIVFRPKSSPKTLENNP